MAKKKKAKKSKKTTKKASKKKAVKKKRRNAKRELIDTGTDKRFVRRGAKGRFKESDDVGRSLAADRRKKANVRPSPAMATRATGREKAPLQQTQRGFFYAWN
jgi:hypothetical protein